MGVAFANAPRAVPPGAYFIADHAGDWLRLNSLEGADGFERLEAIKYRPPPPPDPASDAEHSAVVEVEQRSTGVVASSGPTPSPFWLTRHASGAYMVQVSADGRWYLCEHAADPQKLVAAAGGTAEGVNTSALFELQRVVAPEKEREQEAAPPGGALSFVERAKRCVMRKGGRDVVLATYHNIGMMDWASLFWGWLKASAIDRFFLLELDGLTCKADRPLTAVQPPCCLALPCCFPLPCCLWTPFMHHCYLTAPAAPATPGCAGAQCVCALRVRDCRRHDAAARADAHPKGERAGRLGYDGRVGLLQVSALEAALRRAARHAGWLPLPRPPDPRLARCPRRRRPAPQ